jgi:hypothetical protein
MIGKQYYNEKMYWFSFYKPIFNNLGVKYNTINYQFVLKLNF